MPKSSASLDTFVSSTPHVEVSVLVAEALRQIGSGQCDQATKGAERIAAAIRKALGGIGESMDTVEIKRRLKDDPSVADAALRTYKLKLIRLALALDWLPAFAADATGLAKRRACDRLRNELAAVRVPAQR